MVGWTFGKILVLNSLSMRQTISCSIEICSLNKTMCPGILFKIAVCVLLCFRKNIFLRKKFFDRCAKFKVVCWENGNSFVFEACEREFHALYEYYIVFAQNIFVTSLYISRAFLVCVRCLDRFGGFSAFRSGLWSGRLTTVPNAH